MVEQTSTVLDLLLFDVAGQRHGVPLAQVREVVRAAEVTPLPGAPAVVEGVLDVRGRVVPVLDVRSRLVPQPFAPRTEDHFVLAMAGPRLVALRVDRALDVVHVTVGQIVELRGLVPVPRALAGVVRLPDGLVLLDDLAAFLSQAEATQLDAALAPKGSPP